MKFAPVFQSGMRAARADQLLHRLRHRLVVGLVLTGLLLAGVVAMLFYQASARQLEQALLSNAELQMTELDSRIRRLMDIAGQIASRTLIRQKLEAHVQGALSREELAAFSLPKLADAMRGAADVTGISRLDREGRLLVRVGESAPRSLWPAGWRTARQVRVGRPGELEAGSRLVVSAPLLGSNGDLLGVDLVVFDARPFHQRVEHFLQRFSDTGMATMAVSEGDGLRLFFSRGVPERDGRWRAVLRDEVGRAVREVGHPLPRSSDPATGFVSFHGRIAGTDWVFVYLAPVGDFYAPARWYAGYAGAAVMLLALVGTFLSLLLARPLARQISRENATLLRLLEENRGLLEWARSSEEKFRNLVETTQDWFWEVDAEGTYTYVSPRCRELLGYEPEQILGRTPFDFMDPAEAERLRPLVRKIIGKGLPIRNLENVNRHRDGRRVVLETSALPFFSADGVLAGYRGADRDVTARRQAEEELRQSEESYRGLFESVQDAIFIQDLEGRIIEVNPAAEAMYGQPRDWFLGRAPAEFMADRSRNDVQAIRGAWKAVLEGKPQRFEYWARRPDGEVFPMEVMLNRGSYRGRPVVIAEGRDVSEFHSKEKQLEQAAVEWNLAMDQLDNAIYLLDMDRHLLRANRAFYRLLGTTEAEAIGRHIVEIVHPRGGGEKCPVCRAQEAREDALIVLEAEDPNNPVDKPLEASLKILRDDQGRKLGMLMSLRDLSRSRRIEERLRLAASVFENTDEGVVITDARGDIVEVNRAFTEILGYAREEVLGRKPSLWKSGRHDESFYRGMWTSLRETGRWRGELWNRRKNGEVFPEWLTISSITDDRGELTHYVAVFSDISQIKHSQAQLDHLAHHDALTDLPNRLLLNERLSQAIRHAQRQDGQLALIFLDLDRFKHINDSLGHPAGDRLLQEVGRKLLGVVRRDDTVARIGGDEFVLLLEEIGRAEEVALVAEKIRAIFAEPFDLGEHEVRVTGSLGISIYPRDGSDPSMLLRNADAAMYRAKEEGRDTFHYYTEELTRNAFERVLLENSLRQALEKEEFHLAFQPQVSLRNGELVGCEALLRWHHPELGQVSPNRFIPIAEETGLINAIGDWVLLAACNQARTWLERDIAFGQVSVNIAGPQIRRGGLVGSVARALEESGLPAERLELEVTEGFIMREAEYAIRQLEELREMGVKLAIDDFGTGYSSLSYLKKLPIQKLKIDRSFVHDIPEDPNDMAIAGAVIALGHSLGLTVIAEGVETVAQADFLREAGCEQAQGFLYGRPLEASGWNHAACLEGH